jgi:exonuclease SbcC
MINHVEMINWRAYGHQEISFGPGITFLMGANGVGKTSILEAIAYGLTGEPSTVKDRGKLLRDTDKLATVRLSFTVDGQEYLVERSQSYRRADSATLKRATDSMRLASAHKNVTAKIEDLMGVSADFLQRIVYMAEGDVFRFLSQPPGKALDLQIRRVLGLTQLDEFLQAMQTAEKEIRLQMRELRDLLGQVERLGVEWNPGLEDHMRDIDARREKLLMDLRAVQEEIDTHTHENETLLRLAPLLDRAVPALQLDADTWDLAQRTPILALFTQLDHHSQGAEATIQEHQVALARIEGEQSGYQRILDLLLPYSDRPDTLPCPVCGKPMTQDEREHIVGEVQGNIRRITKESSELNRELAESSRLRDRLREQVEGLRELRNVLAHLHFESISSEASIRDVQRVIQSQQARFQDHLNTLQSKTDQLKRDITQIEGEKAEYLAVQHRLGRLGYASIEEASEALVDLEIRSLSLRAASSAAQETLATQRNMDMGTIYAQMARVWGAFLGQDDWHIQLDSEGNPVLEDSQGHEFDLSQFSGGEKTALLVMLHTIIAHHFSQSDFLLIDEPLEHLDAVNRRSLIRFLVGAYRRRSFQQAIIATFEESLIRKYMSEEGVNVIHLQ